MNNCFDWEQCSEPLFHADNWIKDNYFAKETIDNNGIKNNWFDIE